ncbi:acetaldehyde dehydrogenase (acetylating) [Thalassococcus sp. S3]|uniref:acetaldehyde dehydrogenase (acetylating) n=1 Tax=Thalassococcus sp. S3 TaxID=2017482 RepID=UPI00102446F8|nr:acetaldehyde dehydrogenase (acetylating) [Thalassococcus sp. S3]QBF33364.1 acetaldehyde dehydrogenase (acetylating) [Thalassococcus sp. S3]
MNGKTGCAIIGSGNIGTDLMLKLKRSAPALDLKAVAGIDPASDGLKRAAEQGVAITAEGLEGLMKLPVFQDIQIVFDATSAKAHLKHDALLRTSGRLMIDLTPAAIGPVTVPTVNGAAAFEAGARNLNMVTCGGQATIPIVHAISQVASVHWAEIVASLSSRSAGPGTRANIDEFTQTTARAIETVGGARKGKAIIILNPAEPPLVMRNTVICLCERAVAHRIERSVKDMVTQVQRHAPGYRLKQDVQIESIGSGTALRLPGGEEVSDGLKVSVFLEVEGAGDYLPRYSGNLDIMTSAALATAERVATRMEEVIA